MEKEPELTREKLVVFICEACCEESTFMIGTVYIYYSIRGKKRKVIFIVSVLFSPRTSHLTPSGADPSMLLGTWTV